MENRSLAWALNMKLGCVCTFLFYPSVYIEAAADNYKIVLKLLILVPSYVHIRIPFPIPLTRHAEIQLQKWVPQIKSSVDTALSSGAGRKGNQFNITLYNAKGGTLKSFNIKSIK